ncbi:hypothetical protein FBY51_1002 [Zymomonas mobilis]|nr:hypothetical protein ZZ6_1543 [Zymomonas mobilis subsp. mobilis ATCC 29191]TQK78833.1 hypothetical protein FBY53_1527 [Zymomonas mobilis]TQL15965.1 hypothetical protein FBY51_1002 [Zymomonas mobilis]
MAGEHQISLFVLNLSYYLSASQSRVSNKNIPDFLFLKRKMGYYSIAYYKKRDFI